MTLTGPRPDWMLYGAYGLTGRLILDEALSRGQRPVLAGRDGERLAALRRSTWAHAEDDSGRRSAALLETGEGYRAAAQAAVHAVALQVRDRHVGALPPVQAFGPDFALLAPGTRIQEI